MRPVNSDMEKYLSKNWLCCVLIGLFTLLLWGQSLRYGFVWDDEIYISKNQSIRSLAKIPVFFYSMAAQSSEEKPTSYRPIRNTVFALLHALDFHETPQPWIFHLANVLGHAAVAMLLFLVSLLLWQRLDGGISMAARGAALLVALGFVAHPANAEVVCWSKCLDDVLAALFVLAAARSLLKWNEGGRGYIAALAWFLLAAFTKESAVPFALVAFFILNGFHKLRWRRSAKLTIPFLLEGLFYAVCRHLVAGRSSQCPPLAGSYGQTLINMFPVVSEYLRLLLGIPPFCADYNYLQSEPPHPFLSVWVLEGLFLVLLFGVLAAWLWRLPRWRMSAFGLIWIALFMLPVSNLIPMMQYMAERFLYLPMIGFLLALGGMLLNWQHLRRVATAAALALIVVWSAASLNRAGIWSDTINLFVRSNLEHPGLKRLEKNAVIAILTQPQMVAWRAAPTLSPAQAEQMISILRQARLIFPQNDVLTTQLGWVEAKMGRWPEATLLLALAVHQNPASAEHWYNLASVYRLAGQTAKAKDACAQSLLLDPKFEDARLLQAKLNAKAAP
jgi:hypothetical protein